MEWILYKLIVDLTSLLVYAGFMTEELTTLELVPSKLKSARAGRPPVETARRLGISYQYLNQIENGKRNVSSAILVKMCKLYEINNILDLTNQSDIFLPSASTNS